MRGRLLGATALPAPDRLSMRGSSTTPTAGVPTTLPSLRERDAIAVPGGTSGSFARMRRPRHRGDMSTADVATKPKTPDRRSPLPGAGAAPAASPGRARPGRPGGVRRWVRSARRPTAVDLFCGAGGLSLGLRDAGFTVLVGADSDPACVETHTANLGGLGYVGDLSDPTSCWSIWRAGGFAASIWSRAGRRVSRSRGPGRAKIRSLVARGRARRAGSAGAAVAGLHGGGRATAAPGGAGRERSRPSRPGTTAPS